jgi:prepilin peptidase CpaA
LTAVIVAVCVAASVTDLLRGKIYNVMTLPALLFGLGFAAYSGGMSGFLAALGAAALGLVLYGWMYGLRFLGAGDVKLLAALGALGGSWQFVVQTAILGVLFGGVLALVILLAKGKLPGFYARMREFFLGLLVKELEVIPPRIDQRERMPFGIPIAAAAICVRVLGWGVGGW